MRMDFFSHDDKNTSSTGNGAQYNSTIHPKTHLEETLTTGQEGDDQETNQLFDYVFFFFMPILTLVGVTGNILVLVIGEMIHVSLLVGCSARVWLLFCKCLVSVLRARARACACV